RAEAFLLHKVKLTIPSQFYKINLKYILGNILKILKMIDFLKFYYFSLFFLCKSSIILNNQAFPYDIVISKKVKSVIKLSDNFCNKISFILDENLNFPMDFSQFNEDEISFEFFQNKYIALS